MSTVVLNRKEADKLGFRNLGKRNKPQIIKSTPAGVSKLFELILDSERESGDYLFRGLYQKEFQFHPTRKWRFDYAFAAPSHRIAIEIEGGVDMHGNYEQGRHTRGRGFQEDCEKLSEAALLGWRVFRFTTQDITQRPSYCMNLLRSAWLIRNRFS